MIKSTLGEVQLTTPNYELCSILNITHEVVDDTVRDMLVADCTAILGALADVYGAEKALEIWTESAETFIKFTKGE